MGRFEPGPFTPHQQQQHSTAGQGFGGSERPLPPARGAFHLTEVIQNGIGLRTDGFSLAGDQAALGDFDSGDALLGDQGLDLALAENGICA